MKRIFTRIGKITISLGVMIWIIMIINLNATFQPQEIDHSQTDFVQKFNNPFSSNSPSINFFDIFEIDDDNIGQSIGNNDGEIDAGETIEMRIRLENQGDQDATIVSATISCTNSKITIITDFQYFLTIQNGTSGVSSSHYVFEVKSSTRASDVISFSISIDSIEGNWNDEFNITIMDIPVPMYHTYSVISEVDGDIPADNDDIIDAGEIISLRIYVKNLGGANLIDLTGIISENDVYITVQDNSGDFGTINGNGGSSYGIFGITVSGSCPDKHQIDFDLTITDGQNTKWVLHFALVVNGSSDYELLGLVYNEYEGDGDEFFDTGEVWDIEVNLNNTGDANGFSIFIFLDSQDQYVEFYRSSNYRNVSCGSLGVGLNYTFSPYYTFYWRFTVSDETPRDYNLQLTLEITDSSEHEAWLFSPNRTIIGKSDYELLGLVYNEYEGDGDDFFDAGEVWDIEVNLNNTGDAIGHSIYIFLDSQDQYVVFYRSSNYRNVSCGSLGVGLNNTFSPYYTFYWRFTVSDFAPRNYLLHLTIEVVDASEHETWIFFQNKTVIEESFIWVLTKIIALTAAIIAGLSIIIYTIRISISSIRNWIPNLSVRRQYKGSKKEKSRLQELIQEIDEGLFNTTGKHKRKNFLISLKTSLYAKVVLLGESSVGKTHLVLTMTDSEYSPTQGSTIGVEKFYKSINIPMTNYETELCFWDLGGQWHFNVINEHFLNEATVVLLVYDVTRRETFRSLNTHLTMIKSTRFKDMNKIFIIGNKIDVGGSVISQIELNNFLKDNSLDRYYQTSAKTGEGVQNLAEDIAGCIDWSTLIQKVNKDYVIRVGNFLKNLRVDHKLLKVQTLISDVSKMIKKPDRLMIKAVLKYCASQELIQFGRSDVIVITDPEFVSKWMAKCVTIAASADGIVSNEKVSEIWQLDQNQLELFFDYMVSENVCFKINTGEWCFPNVLHKGEFEINDEIKEILESSPQFLNYTISGSGNTIFNKLIVMFGKEFGKPKFISNDHGIWIIGYGRKKTVIQIYFTHSEEGGLIRAKTGGGNGKKLLNQIRNLSEILFQATNTEFKEI